MEGLPAGFTKFVDEREMREFRHPLTSRNQISQTVKLKKSMGMKSNDNLLLAKDNNSSSPSSRVTSTFSQAKSKSTRKTITNSYSTKIGTTPVKTQASSKSLNKDTLLEGSKSSQNLH